MSVPVPKVFERLPVTFSTFVFDQIKDWALLFPAEQSYYERLFSYLDRLAPPELDNLFAPMRAAEQKMGVSEKVWPKRVFTLEQVDFLNRSPHYADWRAAVAQLFARITPALEAEITRTGRAKLVVVTSPSELPTGPDRMWKRVAPHGKRIAVHPSQSNFANSITDRFADSPLASRYGAWRISAPASPESDKVVVLDYNRLESYRTRLMREVNRLVNSDDVRGPRQLGARLKELKIHAGEGSLGQDPVLAEFTRSVLLSGNGTLLINNTFVEWAAMQAVRRARPSVMAISFGVRNKVKPFSSLLIYADQESTNPIPTQMDTLGTYVDLEVFYQYIWQEFEKFPEYRRNTAYLFMGEGFDEMLVIAPQDYPLLQATKPLTGVEMIHQTAEWLGL